MRKLNFARIILSIQAHYERKKKGREHVLEIVIEFLGILRGGLGHGHKRSRARSLQTVFTLSGPKYFFAHLKVNQSESV